MFYNQSEWAAQDLQQGKPDFSVLDYAVVLKDGFNPIFFHYTSSTGVLIKEEGSSMS